MDSTDPRYYFWKAQRACSQAESICNVARFTEKVILKYFQLLMLFRLTSPTLCWVQTLWQSCS
jgi:hypothetical protein